MATRANFTILMHYLNNFLFMGRANSPDCGSLLQYFADMTVKLGAPLAGDKTEGPTTKISILGI